MPFEAMIVVIRLLLSLAAFLAVGVMSLLTGEELIWTVGKAVGLFLACWIVLGWLSNFVSTVVDSGRRE